MTKGRGPGRRALLSLVVLLGLTTLASSAGWFLAAREGRGIPVDCYTLEGDADLLVDASHGSATRKATFAVSESRDRVEIGYREEVASGIHPMESYGARLTYTLARPLGDRPVVDPSGASIPPCP